MELPGHACSGLRSCEPGVRSHASPHSLVVCQAETVNTPVEWFQLLQIEPVQSEWKKREVVSGRGPFERRLKPTGSQRCTNGFSLPLQEEERQHRSEPPDVHRV